VSACSGHGFKFGPVTGEIAADLALDGESVWDLAAFDVRRFDGQG
jgi:sarcosine oxidase